MGSCETLSIARSQIRNRVILMAVVSNDLDFLGFAV